MGQLPLRFDNNYAQKESIRRLQGEAKIGHLSGTVSPI